MCTRSIVESVLLWSVRQYESYIQHVYNFIVTVSGSIICSQLGSLIISNEYVIVIKKVINFFFAESYSLLYSPIVCHIVHIPRRLTVQARQIHVRVAYLFPVLLTTSNNVVSIPLLHPVFNNLLQLIILCV